MAMEHGASAGKITGAGGGGFLLLYCHEEHQDAVTAALENRGLTRMNFRFDHQGASVILNVASFSPHWVEPYTAPELTKLESSQAPGEQQPQLQKR
jgi:D-glycero-alpha-D-manno-heptose-7-phosphate kinase